MSGTHDVSGVGCTTFLKLFITLPVSLGFYFRYLSQSNLQHFKLFPYTISTELKEMFSYKNGNRGSIPDWGRIFLSFTPSRPALDPTRPPFALEQ
jgi:hypothetical protein